MNSKKFDVIILGAGAAGLMCAAIAGQRGRSVLVLDHANKPGKKILMSGGGRCNFTNLEVRADNFISHNSNFCKSALSRYTPQDFIALVKRYHIPFHEKTLGQLFCDNKSKDILNLLLSECEKSSVMIRLNTSVNTIEKQADFELNTTQGKFRCESLVIATGGLSIPTMGASPFGYQIAEQFGLNVYPTRAALVPFTWQDIDKETYAALSGVSMPCVVSCQGMSFKENLLFTHRGLSGPAMLQISSYWASKEAISIDLVPQKNLFELLKAAQTQSPKLMLKSWLEQHFPKRVVAIWLEASISTKRLADCSHALLKNIANAFNQWQIKPGGTEGYRTAEVTLGGVDCNAISSKTFEAKQVPGLYFIGEVLDVTGWLGGYNFQWAWSSAAAAGSCV